MKLPARFFKPSTTEKMRLHKSTYPIIGVHALDHDGCFGIPLTQPTDIKELHQHAIHYLKEDHLKNNYRIQYVISGSNRQSIRLDCINALFNHNNLAFPVARTVAAAIDAYFDPLLLADITAQKKPGHTIQFVSKQAQIKKIDLSLKCAPDEFLDYLLQKETADFIFSEDKINIVYAQIHRFALLHLGCSIHWNFYDDSYEIINSLYLFFSKNPDLVPERVTLFFHHYSLEGCTPNDSIPSLISSIKGRGAVDHHYYQTINKMGELAQAEEGQRAKYSMAQYICAALLKNNYFTAPI